MLEVREHGTPYKDAVGVVYGAADKFEYAAGTAPTLMGRHVPVETAPFHICRGSLWV